ATHPKQILAAREMARRIIGEELPVNSQWNHREPTTWQSQMPRHDIRVGPRDGNDVLSRAGDAPLIPRVILLQQLSFRRRLLKSQGVVNGYHARHAKEKRRGGSGKMNQVGLQLPQQTHQRTLLPKHAPKYRRGVHPAIDAAKVWR